MRVGIVAVAYNEERLIGKHLSHIPNWVDEKLVLLSLTPWHGGYETPDKTDEIAREKGATVIVYAWPDEAEQRNAGQEYFADKDWIIVLDPDEFLDREGWENLERFIYGTPNQDAFVAHTQLTYWKSGYRIDPPEDYKQIILVKPSVRFVDKRVVDSSYGRVPLILHHLSWAKTDDEVRSKINHYSHANEFDRYEWYEKVWKKWTPEMENLHPLTPEALKKAIPAELPKELERLRLWPGKNTRKK